MGRYRGPPQIYLSLCQKPTRAFQKKLDATLRDLKSRGFGLYVRCKQETNTIINEVKEMALNMKKEQEEALA